jgi:ribosomal protein S27AE
VNATIPWTYVHGIPADAGPELVVTDEATGKQWPGIVWEGLVYDASGTIEPHDLRVRFTLTLDDRDVTDDFAFPSDEDPCGAYPLIGTCSHCEHYTTRADHLAASQGRWYSCGKCHRFTLAIDSCECTTEDEESRA